jgi:NADPH:quinone reductase-like Zn-dependent oxidoreductase
VPEPVDKAAELEDVAPDEGADGDAVLVPVLQPVLTAPSTRVATAQPATVTRANSMALLPTPRRLTLLRNGDSNKAVPIDGRPPMLARGGGEIRVGKEHGMTASKARAVRFDRYGGREVLYVADIEMPSPSPGEVVVEVRAAGINPGEAGIRVGAMHEMFPATFPSGEGSDLAGVVTAVGSDVTEFSVGDEVLGFSFRRSSHATHTAVPVDQLIRKPPQLSWEVAGSLYVVGATAYAAVRAVAPQPAETVVVSAAAGGVGSLTVQLLVLRKARVLGIAGPGNADWLRAHNVIPIAYGEGLADRLREAAPDGIDAFIDLFGPEYVQLAVDLGVAPERIDTIISFQKAGEVGAKTEGSTDASTPEVLAEMAHLVVTGAIDFEIAATYPLDRVADAFEELEKRHTRGKIVLLPNGSE